LERLKTIPTIDPETDESVVETTVRGVMRALGISLEPGAIGRRRKLYKNQTGGDRNLAISRLLLLLVKNIAYKVSVYRQPTNLQGRTMVDIIGGIGQLRAEYVVELLDILSDTDIDFSDWDGFFDYYPITGRILDLLSRDDTEGLYILDDVYRSHCVVPETAGLDDPRMKFDTATAQLEKIVEEIVGKMGLLKAKPALTLPTSPIVKDLANRRFPKDASLRGTDIAQKTKKLSEEVRRQRSDLLSASRLRAAGSIGRFTRRRKTKFRKSLKNNRRTRKL
jgi:hypothetical protein